LVEKCQEAKKTFFQTAREQKKRHWVEFLEDPGNIWKVAKYLNHNGGSGFTKIPPMNMEQELVSSNEEIASTLLQEFFPAPPVATLDKEDRAASNQLSLEPISEDEVKKAIFKAKSWKAPGVDGLPAVVWQELWPILKYQITALF
jgi:hypothetical protein